MFDRTSGHDRECGAATQHSLHHRQLVPPEAGEAEHLAHDLRQPFLCWVGRQRLQVMVDACMPMVVDMPSRDNATCNKDPQNDTLELQPQADHPRSISSHVYLVAAFRRPHVARRAEADRPGRSSSGGPGRGLRRRHLALFPIGLQTLTVA